MTPDDTKQLAADVKKVMELDAKRVYAEAEYEKNSRYDCAQYCREEAAESLQRFESQAPLMAGIIRLREAIKVARDAENAAYDRMVAAGIGMTDEGIALVESITHLDAILKEGA